MHMKMNVPTPISKFLIIFTILLLCFSSIIDATCLESEKQALIEFQKDLKDPTSRLSSWIDQHIDCCKWEGVVCSNKSGNVIQLLLRNPGDSALSGKISPSLLNLTQLHYLDLSLNDFRGIHIPSFLGSLKSLRYLNLSLTGFQGIVPHQLGNISSLQTLSIGGDYGIYSIRSSLRVDNLQWLTGLSNLEYLDMNYVNLSTTSNWLEVINIIPSLVELHLSSCDLIQISQLIHVNFSSLTILDLSENSFGSLLPRWIFGLNALVSLDLSVNSFESPWPKGPWNLTSLNHLVLSRNLLNGSPPRELFNINMLVSLDLSYNMFEIPWPRGPWNLTSLNHLDLSSNLLRASPPRELFNLNNLIFLSLRGNGAEDPLFPHRNWNLSSLKSLDLASNSFNWFLPSILLTLSSLIWLDVNSNSLQGSIPNTVANISSLRYLDLSFNHLNSSMPKWLYNCTRLESLMLYSNQLQGAISDDIVQLKKLRNLDLSDNSLSGSIPLDLGSMSSLEYLHIEGNKLTGILPESLGQLSKLRELYMFENSVKGIVTESLLDNLTNLRSIYASGNSLTLKASASWIPHVQYEGLGLGSWNLGPKFPTWLQSQKHIWGLNLSSTGISGSIPSWVWNLTTENGYLFLSDNQLHGEILNVSGAGDISLNSNRFCGPLPQLNSQTVWSLDLSNNLFSGGISHFLCDVKNEDRSLRDLDLSDNFLLGEIPNCWMNWSYLVTIKLNNNNFTGSIPRSILNLEGLQELHLRNNSLSGQIPLTL